MSLFWIVVLSILGLLVLFVVCFAVLVAMGVGMIVASKAAFKADAKSFADLCIPLVDQLPAFSVAEATNAYLDKTDRRSATTDAIIAAITEFRNSATQKLPKNRAIVTQIVETPQWKAFLQLEFDILRYCAGNPTIDRNSLRQSLETMAAA